MKHLHAISSKAVATNQLIFLCVILARKWTILSCHDIPAGGHKQQVVWLNSPLEKCLEMVQIPDNKPKWN